LTLRDVNSESAAVRRASHDSPGGDRPPLEQKAQLIRSLQLDRTVRVEEGGRKVWPIAAGSAAAGMLAAFAIAFWVVPETQRGAPAAPAAAAANDAAPAASVAPGSLIASGYVVARRQATVAAEITGRLVEVRVEEGQSVTRGQVLAILDTDASNADLSTAASRRDSAAASVDMRRAEVVEAGRVLARSRELADRGFTTKAELSRLEARAASAQAQLAQARAEVASASSEYQRARLQVGRHIIRAPFSGIVVSKNAQAGEIISPISAGGGFTRTGICTLVDMGSLEIEVDVNEQYIGRVQPGQRVDAVLNAYPNKTYSGRVIATVPTADRNKSTVKVRIAFAELDRNVLPDMAVKVALRTAQAGV
jgi:RND family efflux transporter MFP subunit